MQIIIDSREKERKDRAKKFYTDKGNDATVERLDVGDYVFDDKVCFEYKRIDDFMQSIKNESLFNEAANQALQYPHHYVIVVGSLKHFVTSKWNFSRQRDYPKYIHENYSRYYGAIRRLRTFTTTIEVETEEQAFNEMLEQANKCLDCKSRYYSNIVRESNIEGQDVVDFIIGRTKGISSKRIPLIRETLKIETIKDLLSCSVEDFKQVKGIGKKTAQNLYDFIHSAD